MRPCRGETGLQGAGSSPSGCGAMLKGKIAAFAPRHQAEAEQAGVRFECIRIVERKLLPYSRTSFPRNTEGSLGDSFSGVMKFSYSPPQVRSETIRCGWEEERISSTISPRRMSCPRLSGRTSLRPARAHRLCRSSCTVPGSADGQTVHISPTDPDVH